MAPGSVKKILSSLPFRNNLSRSLHGRLDAVSTTSTSIEATENAEPIDTMEMDPAKAKVLIDGIRRFRVLVMGRANAGKTTILQRVCNTMEDPEVFDENGNTG
ncbi:hypothetical protein ID866_9237 [Astraeus odoratus]|nr:hypothetical protein ID866_9237 [Astraeus odoratus]